MVTRRDLFERARLRRRRCDHTLPAAPSRVPQPFFGLHPFIEQNPKAVFIRRTNVPHKMHEESKLREGLTLAREIFVPKTGGIPISHRIVLKPNVCSVRGKTSARGELGHWHRSRVLRRHGHGLEGTRPVEVPLRRSQQLPCLELPRLCRYQRAPRHRDERAVSAASAISRTATT